MPILSVVLTEAERMRYRPSAVMSGVSVPVVSRLLCHSNVQMTLRYAPLADKDIEAAAERVGSAMARAMALEKINSMEHPYTPQMQRPIPKALQRPEGVN